MNKIILTLIIGIIIGINFVSAVSLNTNLAGYYTFNNTDLVATYGSIDRVGGLHPMLPLAGRTNGTGLTGYNGVGQAFGFIRTATDEVRSLNMTNGTVSFSFAGWVKFSNIVPADQYIFWKGNPNGGSNSVHALNYQGANAQFIATHYGAGADIPFKVEGRTNMTAGQWYYIVYTYDGSTKNNSLYINGTLINWTIGTATTMVNNSLIAFGGDSGTRDDFDGQLDEIAIWDNRTLTTNEVTQLWNTGLGKLYPFNTDSISVTLNSPSNNNFTYYTEVVLNATATSDVEAVIENMTIWSNNTGVWKLEEIEHFNTSKSYMTSDTYNMNVNNITIWNYYACANNSIFCEFSGTNYTVIRDATAPTITVISPSGTNTANNGSLFYSATINELFPSICIFNGNGTNITVGCNNNFYFLPTTRRNIEIWANDSLNNRAYSNSTYDWKISLNLVKPTGGFISYPQVDIPSLGLSYTNTNPINRSSNTFLTGENNIVRTIFTTDNEGIYGTINESKTVHFNSTNVEYNITLSAKNILLNFTFENGTASNVTGLLAQQGLSTTQFRGTQYSNNLGNLSLGRISFMFCANGTYCITNYSQWWEFENDWVTEQNEKITIIGPSVDGEIHFKFTDKNGNGIQNILVRLYQSNTTIYNPVQNLSLITNVGQKFTDSSGKVYFFTNSTKFYSISAIRDDYDTYSSPDWYDPTETVGLTSDNPHLITMEKTEGLVANFTNIVIPRWFDPSNTTYIPIFIYSTGRSRIIINTDYGVTNGVGNTTVIMDELKRGTAVLDNSYWNTSSTNDITVYFYGLDGSLFRSITIASRNIDRDKFNEPTGIDETYKKLFIWIVILVSSGLIGKFFEGEEDPDGKGKYVFFVAIILANFIFGTIFKELAIIGLMYFLLLMVRKWISE